MLNSLVTDALEVYADYGEEDNSLLFDSTLKITKATAYKVRVPIADRKQFNVSKKGLKDDSQSPNRRFQYR